MKWNRKQLHLKFVLISNQSNIWMDGVDRFISVYRNKFYWYSTEPHYSVSALNYLVNKLPNTIVFASCSPQPPIGLITISRHSVNLKKCLIHQSLKQTDFLSYPSSFAFKFNIFSRQFIHNTILFNPQKHPKIVTCYETIINNRTCYSPSFPKGARFCTFTASLEKKGVN